MMMALTVHLTAFEIVYERTEQHQKVGNLGGKAQTSGVSKIHFVDQYP